MVQVVAIGQVDVHIGAGVVTERREELLDQLQFEVADLGFRQGDVIDEKRPAGEIENHCGQRFVHRHAATAITANP